MKLELREFQENAVDQLFAQARLARGEIESSASKPQTLILASPTGSGKTLMATAFIDRVLTGDEEHEGDPEASFLWFSYQPDLNDQTSAKMAEFSGVLSEPDLVTIEHDTFDQERFTPGRVHFLNAQKLGQDKRLVTRVEGRSYTLWETVENTRKAAPSSFYVIIDEAHKGTQASGAAGEQAESIMQKFLLGSQGEIAAADLVLGISATPKRFEQLAGHDRIPRSVTVKPEDVRVSGLLKDRVVLFHPDEAGTVADQTLLGEAAEALARFEKEWEAYTTEEQQPSVRPLLVLQVEDAPKGKSKKATATDLEESIATIDSKLEELEPVQIAHAFQEGVPLEAAGMTIRYLTPAEIADDPDARVVIFKQALNTGWDCPRAEVMMSFRIAKDHTHIAQLIGRMVRSPLARRIETAEFLNSVSLYLPRFDTGAVAQVVEYLTAADTDHQIPVDVDPGKELVDCAAIAASDLIDAYQELPSFSIPRDRGWSDRRRLLRLGRALEEDEISGDAEAGAVSLVVDAIDAELKARRRKKAFKDAVSDKGSLILRSVEAEYGAPSAPEGAVSEVALAATGIDSVFGVAGRVLGNGLHLQFLKERLGSGGKVDPATVKLELAALADDPAALEAIDAAAKKRVDELMTKHRAERRKLPANRQDVYGEIAKRAKQPERVELVLPTSIQVRRDAASARDKHLFAEAGGTFPGKLNTWESKVIDEELSRPEVVGWLRNIDRKDWALCIPYEYEDRVRGLFPDLIVFRKESGSLVVDILDPHRPDLDDAWAKAKGLAAYARDYGEDFGRIQSMVVGTDGSISRIDLNDDKRRKQALKLDSNVFLKDLYEQTNADGL